MKTIFTAMVFSASLASAGAAGTCANMAKFGAIRAYHSEMGVVQGSDGIQYSAELIDSDANNFSYRVTISDNNEDGDTWDVHYTVKVQLRGRTCKVIRVLQDRQ